MKHAKTLSLAAMAAMALMAFLGAGSASATTLCTTTVTPCPAGWQYTTTEDNEIEASLETGTTSTLRNTSGSIEDTCTTSTVKSKITNAGSSNATVAGSGTELTFAGCTNTTTVNNNATCSLEVHNITNTDNFTLTGSGCTGEVLLFGFPCRYGANNGTHVGIVTGGTMGTIDVKAVIQRIDASSILCPETMVWEAKYTVTSPAGGMYVEPQ